MRLIKADSFDTFNINKTEATGTVGDSLILSIETGPQFAYEYITGTSSDRSVVELWDTYHPEGRFVMQGPGSPTITTTTETGLSATCEVTVEADEGETDTGTFCVGETKNVTLEPDQWKSFSFIPEEDGKYLLTVPVDTYIQIDAYSVEDYEDCESTEWKNVDIACFGYTM